MLLAFFLRFEAEDGREFQFDLGEYAQAMVYAMLRDTDPKLADLLHATAGKKPFTISTPLDERGCGLRRVRAGASVLLRMTVLDPGVGGALARRVLTPFSGQLRLATLGLRLLSLELDPGRRGCGRATYQELLTAPPGGSARFEFVSPTTLRAGGRNLPLPDPVRLFTGLLHKWNQFSPFQLNEEEVLAAVAEGAVMLSRHHIRTEVFRLPSAPQIGFVGRVDFRFAAHPAQQALSALARFALYAGCGYKTGQGMGQTYVTVETAG